MKKPITKYYVYVRIANNTNYYCVAGRELKLDNSICFLTLKEANEYAETKNQALHESRGTSQG